MTKFNSTEINNRNFMFRWNAAQKSIISFMHAFFYFGQICLQSFYMRLITGGTKCHPSILWNTNVFCGFDSCYTLQIDISRNFCNFLFASLLWHLTNNVI